MAKDPFDGIERTLENNTRYAPPFRLQKGTPATSAATADDPSVLLLAENPFRKQALIRNNSAVTVYLGHTSAVTTATGFPLLANETLTDDSTTAAWWGITAGAAADVRVEEVS